MAILQAILQTIFNFGCQKNILVLMRTTLPYIDKRMGIKHAVVLDNPFAVKALLKRGLVEARYNEQYTLLMIATGHGSTKATELLLNYGADIEAKDNYGQTPLMLAVVFDHTETVRLLLDRGADIKVKDIDGQTLLMLAAENGHTETVRLLLDYGADIEARDEAGYTPLMLAADNGHTETVELLTLKTEPR
jgi:ankyrin repeat protein